MEAALLSPFVFGKQYNVHKTLWQWKCIHHGLQKKHPKDIPEIAIYFLFWEIPQSQSISWKWSGFFLFPNTIRAKVWNQSRYYTEQWIFNQFQNKHIHTEKTEQRTMERLQPSQSILFVVFCKDLIDFKMAKLLNLNTPNLFQSKVIHSVTVTPGWAHWNAILCSTAA